MGDLSRDIPRSKAGRIVTKIIKQRRWEDEPNLRGSDLDNWRKMTLVPEQSQRPGIDRRIGVRNPYALAERINARMGNAAFSWLPTSAGADTVNVRKNRDTMLNLLNQEFGGLESGKHEYVKLFDPSNGSPLFPSYLRHGADPSAVHRAAIAAIANSPAPDETGGKNLITGMAKKTMEIDFRGPFPGLGKNTDVRTEESPCSNIGDRWAIYKNAAGQEANYCTKSGAGQKGDIISDVVQGCTRDCYLHAALASAAWCGFPDSFPANIHGANEPKTVKNTYTYTFYYAGVPIQRPIEIASDVVVDKAGTMVYARQSNPETDVWPAMYEKCYGVMNVFSQSGLTFAGRNGCEQYPRPNLPEYSGGNPLESLEHLTGGSWTANETFYLVKDLAGGYVPPKTTECIAKIGKNITWNGTTKMGLTTNPMVAWSYFNSAEANEEHPNQKISYDSEIIVANHSYSILGLINNKDVPGGDGFHYVVLRNPYGRLWGADPGVLKDYLYPGTKWYPTSDFSHDLTLDDGIFALRVNQFILYFKAFGWVV